MAKDERKKKKKKNKKAMAAVICLISIIVIAGAVWAWAQFTSGYIFVTDAVDNYFKAVSSEDRELYKECCYPGKWLDNYINGGKDINDSLDEMFALQSGATYSGVTIVSEETLDEEFADKMTDFLKTRYNVDISISKIEKVNFTLDSDFEGKTDSSEKIIRYCYKTGGKWFFLADPDVLVELGIEG